jgi:DNA-binding transcriptional ArsR family regulator
MDPLDVLSALFHETRQGLLATVLLQPERWWYLTELANNLQKPPSSLQRELSSLVRAGILEQRNEGRKVYFRAHVGSPVYTDLRRLFENNLTPTSSRGAIHAR